MFIVIVESKEVLDYTGFGITKEGTKFIITIDPDGWGDTSDSYNNSNDITKHVKLFKTEKEADKFAKKWKGHPWWCKPNGNYTIHEVFPVTKQVVVGYSLTSDQIVESDL